VPLSTAVVAAAVAQLLRVLVVWAAVLCMAVVQVPLVVDLLLVTLLRLVG
jgi:hypothetical protein